MFIEQTEKKTEKVMYCQQQITKANSVRQLCMLYNEGKIKMNYFRLKKKKLDNHIKSLLTL